MRSFGLGRCADGVLLAPGLKTLGPPQMFLIRMTQLVPQTRFSEFEKTSTVSLSGTGTFATVCKVTALGFWLYTARWREDSS